MTARVLALLLGLGGLVAAVALLARDVGPMAPAEQRVRLLDPTAGTLDTVSVRGRRVEASVGGRVAEIDAETVWLTLGGDAFPVRFPEPHGLAVEDRVLAEGRLRARGGRRWLAVRSWSRVTTSVTTPPLAPDTLGAEGRPESGL